jgi:hypothetical protein
LDVGCGVMGPMHSPVYRSWHNQSPLTSTGYAATVHRSRKVSLIKLSQQGDLETWRDSPEGQLHAKDWWLKLRATASIV